MSKDKLIDRYEEVKAKAERLQREAAEATGELNAAKKQLKELFHVNSLKEAKTKLVQMEAEEHTARKKFEKALDDFERDWADE